MTFIRLPLIAAIPVMGCASPAVAERADQGLIGTTRAVAIVERALAARAMEAELDTAGGRLVYEIDLVRGATLHRVHVDASSGRLVAMERPRIEGWWRGWFDAERMKRGATARPLAASLAALERQTNGRVQDVEFEMENGNAWYEVEVATAAGVATVRLDPVSGVRLAMVYDD